MLMVAGAFLAMLGIVAWVYRDRIHAWYLFRERFESYRTGQKWLAREAIANLVVHRCRKSARARRLLEGILADTVQPTELLSLWGVLKALVLN